MENVGNWFLSLKQNGWSFGPWLIIESQNICQIDCQQGSRMPEYMPDNLFSLDNHVSSVLLALALLALLFWNGCPFGPSVLALPRHRKPLQMKTCFESLPTLWKSQMKKKEKSKGHSTKNRTIFLKMLKQIQTFFGHLTWNFFVPALSLTLSAIPSGPYLSWAWQCYDMDYNLLSFQLW